MEPLYPLLKVMPDAPIVLQVKDGREKDRKHPLWTQKKQGQNESIKISLCFSLPLSRFSYCAPFSPLGGISGEGLSPHTEIPTGSRSSVLFPSALHVPNDFKQTRIHKHTWGMCIHAQRVMVHFIRPLAMFPNRLFIPTSIVSCRIKSHFHQVSSKQMPPLCCYDVDTVEGAI